MPRGPQTPEWSIVANEDRRVMVDRIISEQGGSQPGTSRVLHA
jgi:hypothetical protein